MKVVDLIKFSGNMLEQLHGFGIKIDDYKHLQMYEELQEIINSGGKVSYAVAFICEKYKVCERTVYKVMQRFGKDCTELAVE